MSIVAARYTMRMDLLKQTETRNAVTRQVERTWSTAVANVPCQTRGVVSEGIRTVGSTEQFSRDYDDDEYIKVRTGTRISKRDRITNVRYINGENSAWVDDDGNALIFEVLGSQPIIDPFGRVVEYDVLGYLVQDE